jgi:DNA-directed RNA polymerase subunit RPC12/RpoP
MKLATIPCIACGAPLKRSARSTWGACRQCSARVDAYLRATVGTRDPSAWVRACNLTFGSRDEFTRIAAAERAA